MNQTVKNKRFEKRIRKKKAHFQEGLRVTIMNCRLTVFSRLEIRNSRVKLREEEEACIDRNARGNEGVDLEAVELTSDIRTMGDSEQHEE